ncbi:unnamed protein product [Sphagnum jensenii]|uniref:Transposase n=1 Tax=Sphagnum jensenii TaxID=128206 RepID=A0ABP0XHE3_9BRYO
MTKSRGMWQCSYPRKYGLEVTEQEGAHVKAARCRFCKYYGRQVSLSNRKHGLRKTDQFYTVPFRANLIVKHLEGHHTDKWADYVALLPNEQDTFFDSVQPRANTMYHYMDMEGDEINLVVSTEIVDVIIGEMLFRPEDELDAVDDDLAGVDDRNRNIEKLRCSALQLFKLNENKDGYTVSIKRVMRFKLAIQHVSCGLLFRQVVTTIEQTKNTCKIAKLGDLNDTIVGQYVRILVGHTLQVISNILASDDVWAFAISFDGSQHRGRTFFDVRIRIGVNGVLHNLHLIAMPHFDRHTAANQEAMLVKLLGALFVVWTRKLIGVTTNGEKTNMGHVNGVQVHMVRCAEFKVVQIWCVPHQLDLVVHVAIDEVDGGTWFKTAYTLSTYLRKQSNLITEMGETCPKKTNRWLTLGSVLKFYITHAPRIVAFLDERREQVNNPILTSSWWLLTYAFAPIIAIIIETVVKLQACDLVICQQRQLLVLLANDIRDMFKVRHIDDEADNAFDDLPIIDYVRRDNSFVLLATLREYVNDLEMRAQAYWLAIDANEKISVLQTIAQFAIGLSDGIAKVEAERDPTNNAAVDLAPLVMPMDLVKMRSSTFISEVPQEFAGLVPGGNFPGKKVRAAG